MAIRYKKKLVNLEENGESFAGSVNSHDGFIHTFGYEDIDKIRDTVCEIIEGGYEKLGKTRVPLDKVFTDIKSRYRVFSLSSNENDQDSFCAVAIHQINYGCPRLRYIAGRGELGAKGVYALVEYELQKDGYRYFAEVSGAIEHIYAKTNAYIVPNVFVPKLLRITNKNKLKPEEGDLFHYKHDFGDGNMLTKVLYGFKDKEHFDKISEEIEKDTNTFSEYHTYEDFRKAANEVIANKKKQNESFRSLVEKEGYFVYDILDTATEFFVRLEELHQLQEINEYPKQVFEQADFMLYVVEELGYPSQYKEAQETYKRWRSEVTPLVLLTPKL